MQSVLKTLGIGLVAVSGLAISNVTVADGGTLYTKKLCTTCHGADAKTSIQAIYPKLAGQDAEYLAAQTKHIKDKTRTGGQTGTMVPFTMALTDADITAIAGWIASQPSGAKGGDIGGTFAAKGCNNCHGNDGQSKGPGAKNVVPKLAGQNAEYIIAQTTAIKDGKRSGGNTADMTADKNVQGLTVDDIKAIAADLAGK
ncbi:c-type cytochrome [Candidatus Halobeggiatoa sp. HSG11]|nr:c-type cytochrome [Candidatus Halobeggiatoa sp. HSG11]